MDTASLFANFDLITDAPGGVARVREMILQLAVRGKLVPPEMASADGVTLLNEMRTEREKVAKTGEARMRKKNSVSTADELFPVPRHWAWGCLADVSRDFGQKIPNAPFTYIDVGSIDGKRGCVKGSLAILQPSEAPSRARKIVKPGTVIYSTVRPYLMNIAIIECTYEPEPIASTAFGILHPLHGLSAGFLKHYLRSAEFSRFVKSKTVGIYPAINDSKLFAAPIPIPPLAEQKCIVAKVDELMALCDGLEEKQKHRDSTRKSLQVSALDAVATAETPAALSKAWTRVRDHWPTLTSTPESIASLRETILQLAVRGKLVPQDSTEGTAAEILDIERHQRNNASNIPALPTGLPTLPDKWCWVRLADLVDLSIGRTPDTKNHSYWGATGTEWVSIADMIPGGILHETQKKISQLAKMEVFRKDPEPAGTLLISFKLTIGKVSLLGTPAYHNEAIAALKPDFGETRNYLLRVLPVLATHGQMSNAIKGLTLSKKTLSALPIALPPLNEQKRIVAKVGELVALCDKLESGAAQVAEAGKRYAEAITCSLTEGGTRRCV